LHRRRPRSRCGIARRCRALADHDGVVAHVHIMTPGSVGAFLVQP
jgi:hypothetical protein